MKLYKITFEVPDDFNPDELELNASYKDEINISSERFVNAQKDEILQIIKDKCTFEKATIGENDVIIFKFPKEALDLPDAMTYLTSIRTAIETNFGCPAVGFVGDIDVLVENADQAIDMFNGMIAKVKVRSAVKDTSKIILGG